MLLFYTCIWRNQLDPWRTPKGHVCLALQGRGRVYWLWFLHCLHEETEAGTCPLLSPLSHYVVCASLRVLRWRCQRVLCWSPVWFQGCWPQSQFGTEGGYWHHEAYGGPQDLQTVLQGSKCEAHLKPTDVYALCGKKTPKTWRLISDGTCQSTIGVRKLCKEKKKHHFTVTLTSL